MKTFSEIALEKSEESEGLNEVKLTRRTDYKVIGRDYAKTIEYLYDARKMSGMCTFKVDGVYYYSILIMRDMYLEPHFGVFLEDKFIQMTAALKLNNTEKIKTLMKDEKFVQKDGYTDKNTNFSKVLSYVFSFMGDYLDKKEMGFVKIMGNPRKFGIYKRLVQQNIKTLPYNIIDEVDDHYTNKEGESLPAKAILLKYKFA